MHKQWFRFLLIDDLIGSSSESSGGESLGSSSESVGESSAQASSESACDASSIVGDSAPCSESSSESSRERRARKRQGAHTSGLSDEEMRNIPGDSESDS